MTFKKAIALALVLALALLTLTACGAKKDETAQATEAPQAAEAAQTTDAPKTEDASKALIGTWELDLNAMMTAADPNATPIPGMENASMTFEFTADGKLVLGMMGQTIDGGTYTVADGVIKMDAGAMAGAATGTMIDMQYKIDGNKLSLTADGQTVELTKK